MRRIVKVGTGAELTHDAFASMRQLRMGVIGGDARTTDKDPHMNSQHPIGQLTVTSGTSVAMLRHDPVRAAKDRLSSAVTRILAGDASAAREAEQAQRDLEQARSGPIDVLDFT